MIPLGISLLYCILHDIPILSMFLVSSILTSVALYDRILPNSVFLNEGIIYVTPLGVSLEIYS